MNEENYDKFIGELVSLPAETEWVEFKTNHQTPEKIGQYISSLANSAAMHQQQKLFWFLG